MTPRMESFVYHPATSVSRIEPARAVSVFSKSPRFFWDGVNGLRMVNGCFNSDTGSKGYHIWRQAFPDGVPQQLTASLGEEEGIAMAPDGRSLVTSVGTSERSIWVHDQEGEQQVSSQGYSSTPRLSSDGSRVFYLGTANSSQRDRGGELWVLDLGTGQASKVLPGVAVLYFSVSLDDERVVFETLDATDSIISGCLPPNIASLHAKSAQRVDNLSRNTRILGAFIVCFQRVGMPTYTA
jgi:hypothetical protein